MKKYIAGGAAILAIAAAVPLVALGDQQGGRGEHGKGDHMMMHGDHDGGRGEMGHGGGHGGKHARIELMEALATFDANKDGSITQEEVDQYRADRLKKFDADGDGMLSLQEYEALWLDAMKERMVRGFQRNDRDGDGKVTVEEFQQPTRYMVMMRDRNDDGVVNEEDIKRPRMGMGHGMGMDHGMGMSPGDGTADDNEERPEGERSE